MKPIFEQFGRATTAAALYRLGKQLHALCMFHPTWRPTLTTSQPTWSETSGALRPTRFRHNLQFANRALGLKRAVMDLRLKPQDIVVALKLVAQGDAEWTQPELARSLHLSASEVNHGLKRLTACHLFNVRERRVIRAGLSEFLVSGLRYVFPAQLGLFGRGMPTAFSVSPLSEKLRLGEEDGVVWIASGKAARARGRVIAPLYRNVPLAAAEDPKLHEYLALADTLRIGRAREREMARAELSKRLSS